MAEKSAGVSEIPGIQTIDHVFGMRRSGHHAVIEWLQACHEATGKSAYHENSVYNRHLAFARQWPDPTPEAVWSHGQGNSGLIVSYEDVDTSQRQNSPVYETLQLPEYGQKVRDTVVVRDWFNLAASRLVHQANYAEIGKHQGLIFGLEWPEVEARWQDYAQGLLNKRGDSPSETSYINYNRWFMDEEYREELAGQYGLQSSDTHIDSVPDFAGGSSFDGRTLHGEGRSMNVLRRWEDMPADLVERYERLISNPTLQSINSQLFGIEQEAVLAAL